MTDPLPLVTQSFIGIPGIWLYVIIALSIAILAVVSAFGYACRLVSRNDELPDSIKGRQRSNIQKIIAEFGYVIASVNILSVLFSIILIISGEAILASAIPDIVPGNPGWNTALHIAVLTLALLLFGNTIPKTFAYSDPYKVIRANAVPFLWISAVLKPLTFLMVRRNRRTNAGRVEITMDELSEVLEVTADQSVEEKRMLSGILEFVRTEVSDIMKPRVDIVGLDSEASLEEVIEVIISSGFSRIPVYEETLDNITGILFVKDLLPYISKADYEWLSLTRKPYFVPESKKINDLLDEFRGDQVHMAIVVDEYGSTVGLVSLEDILEEIVGDIADELDVVEQFYTKVSPNVYIFDGKTHLNDMLKVIGLADDYLDDEKGEAESVAGLMLEIHKDFLRTGDTVFCGELTLSADKIDGRRIDKVRVAYKPAE